jgi:DNA-binding NarL/FixJ family response regulator
VKSKTASRPRSPEPERWAVTANKPKLAFARDDTAGAATQPGTPARILVVEDDFLVAADVEAVLLDEGFEIVGVAESAGSAVALAAKQKPSLILMDIRLAGGSDGIDAAVQIYRDLGIRCLFASAHSDLYARKRAEPAQPLGWLQKPYTMAQLVASVKRALSDL